MRRRIPYIVRINPSAAIFSPPDPDAVLSSLANPEVSFAQVARTHATTIDALSAWLATTNILERLDTLDQRTSRITRFLATRQLPIATDLLATIALQLDVFLKGFTSTSASTSTPRTRESHRRAIETARKTAALILRLARFTPGAPKITAPAERSRPAVPISAAPASPTPSHAQEDDPLSPQSLAELQSLLASLAAHQSTSQPSIQPQIQPAAQPAAQLAPLPTTRIGSDFQPVALNAAPTPASAPATQRPATTHPRLRSVPSQRANPAHSLVAAAGALATNIPP